MEIKKIKKPVYKRVWFWLLVAVVLIAIGGATGSNNTNNAVKVGEETKNDSPQTQTSFKAGDVIDFDGKRVTVAPAERNWDSDNQFIQPEGGNEFVKVQVTIENNSSSEVTYNTYDWKLQDTAGVIKSPSGTTYTVDGALSSGELAANGKVSGFLIFEVKTGDANLILRYEPSFWSDKKVEIKL